MRLAIIPARGGSVRIPRKNIRPFYGRPIIEYSIDTAKASKLFDHIVVSTDDEEIGAVAMAAGAEVMFRPEGLEDVGTQEIARHVVDAMSTKDEIPRYACVLYATCPLILVEDLTAGWRVLHDRYPCFAMGVGTEPLRDAGAFYWGEGWAFSARVPLISPRTAMIPIPEARVCDINVEEDWLRAERMYVAQREARCAAS